MELDERIAKCIQNSKGPRFTKILLDYLRGLEYIKTCKKAPDLKCVSLLLS